MTARGVALATIGVLAVLATRGIQAREMSLDERVRHQRAIEEVYWKHRLWPGENASPKPQLSEVMPDAALRSKVETYLKESAALETIWRRPITREQLQAEIDRMVRDTRDERMLADLFQALGNDAGVIAETLARQALADRLIRDWYAHDSRFHGTLKLRAETARAAVSRPEDLTAAGGEYRRTTYRREDDARERIASRFPDRSIRAGRISPVEETWDAFTITAVLSDRDDAVDVATVTWPKVVFDTWWAGQRSSLAMELDAPSGSYAIASPFSADCVPDSWTPTYFGVPDGRRLHTAVWTGSEMIVWGGVTIGGVTSTGGRYSPATNTWTPTSTGPRVPRARSSHTAIWTGAHMVVWGGNAAPPGPNSAISSGARYDPSTDTWLPVSTSGAPSARFLHTATWTGSLMVVWGGSPVTNTGGRYNPSSDTWSATSTGGSVPAARQEHTAVLSFPDVTVWGGRDAGGTALNTGARYSPASDTWTTVSTTGAPVGRWGHAAIWTGSELVVWGGRSVVGPLNTGGRYQASTSSWTATSLGSGLPTPRYDHSYVWTAGKLIVWGGLGAAVTNTGAVYDPPTDTWTQTSLGANVPSARQGASAVWTNNEMIVWGGLAAAALNTGGRYNPVSNSWVATSTGSYVPSARGQHAAVWTGTEMIVWGGFDDTELNTGGRYNAATDVWTPTSLGAGVPAGRAFATAVWTGSRMIVWGGLIGSSAENTGARYDPSTDSWAATVIAGPASARYGHSAVWTGSEMIVWGGLDPVNSEWLDSGARYDPVTDGWAPTSKSNAPSPRLNHTAVWSGSEMIVWGGLDPAAGPFNSGGRYNPATNAWTPTSTGTGVPSLRQHHVAVWTGSEMIVWGGSGDVTGGRYAPATDSWVATSTGAGVPALRDEARAVWSGTEMIVWGGFGLFAPEATGGRYSPADNTWTATSIGSNLPTPRYYHTAVWTGSAMIVWGGEAYTSTGARYCATTCASPNTYYLDADHDGYGVAGSSVSACSMPTGYSSLSTDCNDGDPNVNPGAFDPCNGTDRNCDGVGDTLLPGEVNFGTISRVAGAWRYTWPAVAGLRFDAIRGVYKGAVGTDGFEEYCLYNNTYATTWDDDNGPESGKFWWFLVRGANGCGNGTFGFQTVHTTPTAERLSIACP